MAVVLVALIQYAAFPEPSIAPFVFFYFGVAVVSLLGGAGPALLAVSLSAALANWLFILPPKHFSLHAPALLATFLFAVGASAVGLLCARLRSSLLEAYRIAAELKQQGMLLERSSQELTRLASIIETTEDAVLSKDLNGTIRTWNEGARRLFGYSAEEAIGSSVYMLIPPERRREEVQILERLAAGEHLEHYESERVTKSGDRRIVSVSTAPLRDANRSVSGTASIMRDITDRKHIEEALRESHRRWRQLADSMPQIVWAARADGFLDYYNRKWYELTGADPAAHGDDSWLPILHPDDRQKCLDIWYEAVRTGHTYNIEYRFKFPTSGEYRWHLGRALPVRDGHGNVVRWYGTSTDIHDHKLAEEALLRAKDQLQLVQDAAGIGSWDWDIASGELVWSAKCKALFEIPADTELSHQVFLGAIHPEDRQRVDAAVRQTLDAGRPYDIEMRVPLRSGGTRWVNSKGRAYFGPDGEATRMSGMALDVTERKRAEEELHLAHQRKNEFLGVLSHELRNPLAPIRNSVYLLGLAAPGSEQARRALAVIDRQSSQLIRLVDDLLDVTRIERGKVRLQREKLDLHAVVAQVAEDHREMFEKNGIKLDLDVGHEHMPVMGDSVRLAQVIGNLLWNAAKFTPTGGSTTLLLRRIEDRVAEITVRDTGEGIAPEVLARLFEPFVQGERTLHRSTGGLGLGLALVKGLVALHGGTVSADSAGPGHGATFSVRLPVERRATARLALVPRGGAEPHAQRVLVIEDNVDAAATMKEVLEFNGHEVEVAHTGPDGIVRARTFRPTVVLCDIGLPGMDGFQVARVLRADPELRSVALIALTGYAQPQDLDSSKAAGFDVHLAKPPPIEALEQSMSEACAAAIARDELSDAERREKGTLT